MDFSEPTQLFLALNLMMLSDIVHLPYSPTLFIALWAIIVVSCIAVQLDDVSLTDFPNIVILHFMMTLTNPSPSISRTSPFWFQKRTSLQSYSSQSTTIAVCNKKGVSSSNLALSSPHGLTFNYFSSLPHIFKLHFLSSLIINYRIG